MARRMRNANLESKEARSRLKVRPKPYWASIGVKGAHIGYRRLGQSQAGSWTARLYLKAAGHKKPGRYVGERIADADDFADSNGSSVLNFYEAVDRVRARVGLQGRENNGPFTVAAAVEHYCASLEHTGRQGAAVSARALMRNHALPALGDMLVEKLTPEVLRAWLAGVATGPRDKPGDAVKDAAEIERARKASANRVWTCLRASFNFAFQEGKVAVTPWRRVRPFKGADRPRVRFLTVQEAQRLVNACEPELRSLVECALATGARYSELARLVCVDFNPDAGTLHIRRSKSGKDRHVILNDEGIALFAALTAGRAGSEPILRQANGTEWRPSCQTKPMREAVKRARLDPSVTIHTCRHTYCSLALMAGMPKEVLRENLGHRDMSMIERVYGHLTKDFARNAARQFAPTFGFAPNDKVTPLSSRGR